MNVSIKSAVLKKGNVIWWGYVAKWRFITIFMCVCSFAIAVRADVVVTEQNNVLFGKVLTINSRSAVMMKECNSKLTVDIERSQIKTIVFDSFCAAHPYTLPQTEPLACEAKTISAFRVKIREEVAPVYAIRFVSGIDGTIHLLLATENGSLHGPLNKIEWITNEQLCPAAFAASSNVRPGGYCFEPPSFAVNWSPEPVYNNSIFTKGFSFYLDQVGPGNSQLTVDDVRLAFGTALSLWSSPLLAKRESLDPRLKDFVDKSVSRSKNFVMFVPPQVVNVSCASNALMIVKLYTVRRRVFPSEETVARAQVRGRTILLNGVDHQFVSKLGMAQFTEQDRINLITVFAHELGHAFGLTHNNGGPSIMSNRNPTLAPTDVDIQRFTAILSQSIAGTRPGFFESVDCAGLKLKRKK